jgi:hypothetical protein
MIHVTIPSTANGEPIPLVKYSQGRDETPPDAETYAKKMHAAGPVSFTERLRAAGYQEPVIPNPHTTHGAINVSSNGAIDGMVYVGALPPAAAPPHAIEVPLVSQRGFKAGVFAACLGGVFLGALYFGCGPLICGCVASGCVGFVCGMLLTQEWE